ncbi:MAG: hypothetical protein NTU95_06215 [Methanothrix sp.]|nr:hypothetical protein [Methanothrix sp.]
MRVCVGANTAVLKVWAEVCLRCKERLYSQEIVRRFEQIKAKLERQETEEFRAIGVSYHVAQFRRTIHRRLVPPLPLPVLAHAHLECGCCWWAELPTSQITIRSIESLFAEV